MEVFDDVTHYLMPWHTFWRHDELFNVMVCSLLGDEFFVVMTYFMTCLHCPDIFYFIILGTKYYENVFLMSLSLWYIIYFMVNVWRHDKPNVIMPCCWWTFWRHRMFLTSWRTFFDTFVDGMTCFWRHSKFAMSWHVFDFMTHCFDDVMTNLLTSRRVFDVIDVFWRVCDIMTNFLKYMFIFIGQTHLKLCMTTQTFWYIWCHDKSFDVTACFWCHWRVLTCLWHHD